MKNISILFFLFLFGSPLLFAQQETHYSMFMFNKLNINPAYAGSKEAPVIFGLYRQQWLKVDGAPKTINLSFHTPFMNERNGLGVSFIGDEIGLTKSLISSLSYAYRIPLANNSKLSFGLQASMEVLSIDWDEVRLNDEDDELIGFGQESRNKPNFGAGIYYSNPHFYLGFSIPQFLVNNLYENENSEIVTNNDFKAYYLMAGLIFPLSEKIKLQPSVLFSHSKNVPFEIDVNANLVFYDMFWLGASWRHGDSFNAIAQYQFSNHFRSGLAFDFTSSKLSNVTGGGFEILMEYLIDNDKERIKHIRYF